MIPKVCSVSDFGLENVAIDRRQHPLERQRLRFRSGWNGPCSGLPGEHHGASEFPRNLVSLRIAGLKLQLLQRQGQQGLKKP
jgi:hypothetical protein